MDELWIEILAGLGVGTGLGLVGAGGAIFTVPVFGVVLGHPSKSAFLEALAVTGTVAASSGAWSALRGRCAAAPDPAGCAAPHLRGAAGGGGCVAGGARVRVN